MDEQNFLALSDEQRKAFQRELQAQKLYFGPIDGKSGAGMRTALEASKAAKADSENTAAARAAQERADALKAQELELKSKELEQKGQAVGVETEAAKAKLARQQAYDQDANSGLGMATQTAAGAPAALAGVAAGRGMGMGINKLMDASQESKNKVLAAAAQDRVAGLTTREGSRLGSALAGAMPSPNSAARVTGRMLPHMALGTFMAGKGGMMLAQEGEEDPFYPKMIDRAAGLGMIGAGTGLAERGITYGVAPGVAPDAKSIAIIESNQLRRNNAPAQDAPKGPNPGTKAALLADAKEAGIKGVSRMNKGQLAQALLRAGNKAPMFAGPIAAAALAAGMTPEPVQAADGSGGGPRLADALTNAGVAGTAAAGTSYGINKLAKAVPAVGRAIGPAATALTAYDYLNDAGQYGDAQSPELSGSPLGKALAGAMPLAMRGAQDVASIASAPGRLAQALQRMPQVPAGEGSTMYGMEPQQPPMPPPEPAQTAPQPMMNAAALEMPQNVDPQATAQADIASGMEPQAGENPFPAPIQSRVQRMLATGATPQQVASFLNAAIR